jgi:hypothetical protein
MRPAAPPLPRHALKVRSHRSRLGPARRLCPPGTSPWNGALGLPILHPPEPRAWAAARRPTGPRPRPRAGLWRRGDLRQRLLHVAAQEAVAGPLGGNGLHDRPAQRPRAARGPGAAAAHHKVRAGACSRRGGAWDRLLAGVANGGRVATCIVDQGRKGGGALLLIAAHCCSLLVPG